ncbi:MAG: hypothetical protein U5K75_11985 [Ahrensia sp.]|nr:hypothetical protein [Ahrensia sp.]
MTATERQLFDTFSNPRYDTEKMRVHMAAGKLIAMGNRLPDAEIIAQAAYDRWIASTQMEKQK